MATLRERIRQSIGGTAQGGIGQERFGEERFGQDRFGRDLFGQDRMGQERMGQERIGQDRMGQERFGPVNLMTEIRQQHLVLTGLLSRIRDSDPATRRALLPRLRQECLAHVQAEEATIYPALQRLQGPGDEGVEESVLEHMLMERLLQRIIELPADAPEWNQRFNHLDQLISVFMYHIREEEQDLLPLLANRLTGSQEDDLAIRFMQVYQQVKQQIG